MFQVYQMVLTYEQHRTSPGFSERVDAEKSEKHMNSDHANQTPVHAIHAQRHIYPGQAHTKDYRRDRENIVHHKDGTTYTYNG